MNSLSGAVPLHRALTVAIKTSLLPYPSSDLKNQSISEIACRAGFGLKLDKRQIRSIGTYSFSFWCRSSASFIISWDCSSLASTSFCWSSLCLNILSRCCKKINSAEYAGLIVYTDLHAHACTAIYWNIHKTKTLQNRKTPNLLQWLKNYSADKNKLCQNLHGKGSLITFSILIYYSKKIN